MTTRGLGVTQQDLDASRLVFVSVKDARPKRKVAVPIPENGNWEAFIGQVQSKLKLSGVGEIFLASTGERVLQLEQLQDIDELYVVEAARPSNGTNYVGIQAARHSEITAVGGQRDPGSDHESKYVKRNSALRRAAKRFFPSLFPQSLPVTTKDAQGPLSPVEQVRRRFRRRRRSWTDPRYILVLFALISSAGTVWFVYMKAGQGLP